eukprot:5381926-Pyramimonas_sp.AAC.1
MYPVPPAARAFRGRREGAGGLALALGKERAKAPRGDDDDDCGSPSGTPPLPDPNPERVGAIKKMFPDTGIPQLPGAASVGLN